MLTLSVVSRVLLFIQITKAWTLLSTFEAFTTNDDDSTLPRRCIGNCVKGSERKTLCITTWHGYQSTCTTTETRTLRYRTQYNEPCKSDCDNFNGYKDQWCATSDSDWDKCSRRLALHANRTVETNDKYTTCVDECAKRGYSYYWCNGANKKWQYCNPQDITYTFDYSTEYGSVCASRCKLYNSERQPYCYTNNGDWERCFLNPSYDSTLREINTNLHKYCPFGEYDTAKTGYRMCRRLHKRATDDATANELFPDCDADVEFLANRHSANNPTVRIRHADLNNMITSDTNPILSYTLLPTSSYFSGESASIDLPLVVRALLTHNTLGRVREHFTAQVNNNYNGMDRNLQHENYDERGHILASRLGGPMATFNVFTQNWRQNRGRRSMWYGLEADLDTFLRGHRNRYVLFTAVLSYATDDDHVLVHRPTAIMLRVRPYINNQLVDFNNVDLRPLNSTQYNTLENMYFSNDPNHSCEPLPANTPKPPRRRG